MALCPPGWDFAIALHPMHNGALLMFAFFMISDPMTISNVRRVGPFAIPVRVYYQDTDAGGVVFHAQYLLFMERARTEFLNAAGFDLARFAEEDGIVFMVHALAVRYHRAARLNDLVAVSADVVRMGRASFVFRQTVERGAELLVEADVTVALVERARDRPVRIPARLRHLLERSA